MHVHISKCIATARFPVKTLSQNQRMNNYEQLQAIDATEEGFHLPRGCLLALFPLCTDRSEDLQTLRLGPPGSLA